MNSRVAGLLAALISVAFAHAASAADMPAKAPVYKAPEAAATNWTGLYVNGGFGYGLWSADTTTFDPATGACALCINQEQGGKGWLGVVGLGYDYQFAPQFVGGVFGDFNFASIKGTIQDGNPFFAGETKEQRAWAVGARIGYLVTPDILTYVNGGFTSAHFSGANMVVTFAGTPTNSSTPDFTTNGWFIGGGTEVAMPSILGLQLGPGWFWRSEYRYARYENKQLPDRSGGLPQSSFNFRPTVQTVTSQVVYKLNTGGPAYRVAAPAPAQWNGFYVNAGLGYGLWAADTTTINPTTGLCTLCVVQVQGGKGWLGRFGGGFDYVVLPKILVGVFGDYDVSSLKGTIQDQGPVSAGEIKQNAAWTAGVRAGFLLTPRILSYVDGGYAGARFSGTTQILVFTPLAGVPAGTTTPGFTANGWFLGGGMEAAITPNLFWRNEYRVAHYRNKTIPDEPGADSITFKPTVQTVTSQLVYKFNWPR